MAAFDYVAVDGAGRTVSGALDSADEAAARAGLAWGMAVEWAHLLCKMDWYEGLAERATEWVTTTHDRILLQMVGL